MDQLTCLFCDLMHPDQHILYEGEHWYVRQDNYPVGTGHVNIVSRRHINSVFALTEEEWRELHPVLGIAKSKVEEVFQPSGYNIGVNDGLSAGQTIMHVHIHLIPRYDGDVPNPRGGIRNFKPALKPY